MSGRKRAALLAAALLLAGLLAGCHGARERAGFSVPESFDESRPCTISFWAKNDTNKNQVAVYEQAIEDFEALYPNVTVELRLYTDYGKIYNDVITNIATNTTPNVCITYPDHIATYLSGDQVVVPLDELLEDERFGSGGSGLRYDAPGEIVPEFLDEGVIGGHCYALPFMRSTEACYVNKSYVEALGFELPDVLTWDFVWQVADAAAEKDADGLYTVSGQNVMLPFIYKSSDNMMIQLLRQMGADYSDEAGNIGLFSEDTASVLYTVAEHTARGAFSTFKISGYPANFLNAGQCVFAVDSTAGASWMGPDAPLSDISDDKIVDFEIAVRTVPQLDPENPQMISQGPSVCLFNKDDAQEVLASWLFAQYLLTDGVQIAYAQTEGYVPVTTAAQTAPEYRDYLARAGEDSDGHYAVKIAAAQLLLDNTANTFTTPVFSGSASLRDAAGQLIESVTKSVRRGQTVDGAYIDALYADTATLYRLDQTAAAQTGGAEPLGPLPGAAIALLAGLAGAWLCMGAYAAGRAVKRRHAVKRQT